MENLEIDLDELQSAITTYSTAISDFEGAMNKMETAMTFLKNSGWQSGASTAYFSNYDTSWKENMKKHLETIKYLKSCLDYAKSQYSELYQKVHTIGKNL